MSRPALLAVVVALLLAGTGAAAAGWVSSAAGTGTGRGGTLTAPTVTLGTVTCTTSGLTTTATLPVSWAAVPGAAQYVVESSPLSSFALFTNSQTVTGRSTTITTTTPGFPLYVRVRAGAGKWTGPASATASKTITC